MTDAAASFDPPATGRVVQAHATSGQRSKFDKLRSLAQINPRLAVSLARTMLAGGRDHGPAAAFRDYCERGGFEFTYDGMYNNIPFITPLLKTFAAARGEAAIRYMEIGAYEGQNLAYLGWLMPNRLDVTVIDPWFNETFNPDENYHGIEARFHRNMARTPFRSITAHRSFSSIELPKLQAAGARFDLIYVDGSHAALDVMIDMCFCAGLLTVGGMMTLDDYWHDISDISGPGVKQAVDRFISLFGGYFQVAAVYRQVVLIKTAEIPR